MLVWLHRPALLKALDGLIDSESDDDHALSSSQREVQLAQIANDRLMIERQECALVWCCQITGQACEHRSDVSVLALLNLELETRAGAFDRSDANAGVVMVTAG
jgi:hypothetical protein